MYFFFRKKEKIVNCLALTNEISLATVTAAPQALSLSIETLLCLCDDFDSDVRTVADECLNKIIRVNIKLVTNYICLLKNYKNLKKFL